MFFILSSFKAKNSEKLMRINEYMAHKLIQIINIYNYAKKLLTFKRKVLK